MINQMSSLGFGSDANVLAGYAVRGNDRLGNFDLVIENTGNNSLYLQIREYDGTSSPSGYFNLGNAMTIVARGTKTVSMNLLSKQIGFFGSGNTEANISTVLRNPADRANRQIDIVIGGKRGYGYDAGYPKDAFRSPGWGGFPDIAGSPTV